MGGASGPRLVLAPKSSGCPPLALTNVAAGLSLRAGQLRLQWGEKLAERLWPEAIAARLLRTAIARLRSAATRTEPGSRSQKALERTNRETLGQAQSLGCALC